MRQPRLSSYFTTERPFPLTTFAELGLTAPILKMLAAEQHSSPTPIQAQAIPHVLAGRDLIGIAQTGTGKTAAFALPILQRLASNGQRVPRRRCRALVLAPTRELASQINESFCVYGGGLKLSSTVVFGGVAAGPQIRALGAGVDIIVATPGRLLDHLEQGNIRLDDLQILVLDEVDRMLDMGFIQPVRRIIRAAAGARQTLLFSATMPNDVGKLAADFLDEPIEVAVTPVASTVERVEQRVIHVAAREKPALLAEMLGDTTSPGRWCSPAPSAARTVLPQLTTAGVGAAAIHGNKSQGQREQALAAIPRRPRPRPGGDRRRRARHRCRRHHARHQLRAAEHPGKLRSPHRPHGAGRRRRNGNIVLRRRGTGAPARYREADPSASAGAGPAGPYAPSAASRALDAAISSAPSAGLSSAAKKRRRSGTATELAVAACEPRHDLSNVRFLARPAPNAGPPTGGSLQRKRARAVS